uniref:Chemosensory protein n=1 Tax=Panagrellus redivivus TaxID=6233 RepID=A0A7E4ZZ14_PANRE
MVSRKPPVMSRVLLLALFFISSQICHAQMMSDNMAQVKILNELFPVSNAQQINQITWTVLGKTPSEIIYCVSEPPVSQLRFVCVDCAAKNITDMVNVLNSAQDLTRNAGFPLSRIA